MLSRSDVALLSRALEAGLISTDGYAEIVSQLQSDQQFTAESLLVARMGLSRQQLSSLLDSRAGRVTVRSALSRSSAPADAPTVDQSDVVLAESAPSDVGTMIEAESAGVKIPRPASRAVEAQIRFELKSELGKGGLGRVMLVHDSFLGRDVALKEMLPTTKSASHRMQRFISEAQLTGRLEHPGIVPVHAFGLNSDGEPFYVMKRVEGPTLDSRLKEFGKLAPRTEAWTLGFQELLSSLVEVCHAVDYAHSRGVIHRDIKPKNIMIGAFGETLLLDWGLAKSIHHGSDEQQPDDDEQRQHSTVAWSSFENMPDRHETHMGAVVGTVDYMSPEQAKGRIDQVGTATDIYLLGATLYEILTGIAPHRGKTYIEVQSGRVNRPRQVERHVPRALEAVCLKAMSVEPADRYQSAREMAEEIVRWQSRERVHAYREPKWQTGARWVRKHSKQCLAAAACIGAGLLVAQGFRWRDELHLQDLTAKTHSLVITGRDAFLKGDFDAAKKVLEQAQGVISVNTALTPLAADSADWLGRTDSALKLKQERAQAQQKLDQFREGFNAAMAVALLNAGLSPQEKSQELRQLVSQALQLYGVSAEAPQPLPKAIAPYDNQELAEILSGCRQLRLTFADSYLLPASQGENEYRTSAEKALQLLSSYQADGQEDLAYHLRRAAYLKAANRDVDDVTAKRLQQEPRTASEFFARGEALYSAEKYEPALQDFQRALQLDPNHLWAAYFAGIAQLQTERWSDAVASLTAVASRQTKNLSVLVLRGYAFGRIGDLQAAELDFAKALQSADERRFPALINRGVIRLLHSRTSDAIQDFQQARTIRPASSQACVNLARAYFDQGDFVAATQVLDEAVALEIKSPELYRLRAYVRHAHIEQPSNVEEVVADLDQAIENSPEHSRQWAESHLDKGRLYHTHGKLNEALLEYKSAADAARSLPEALALEGIVLRQLDRYDEAAEVFNRFFQLQPYSGEVNAVLAKKTAQEPTSEIEDLWTFSGRPNPLRLLATVHRERGICRLVLNDVAGAEYDFGAMLNLVPNPDALPNAFDRQAWRFARARMGWLYLDKSSRLAEQNFDDILKGSPDNAEAYAGRGYARATMHRLDDAIRDAETAREKLGAGVKEPKNAEKTPVQEPAKVLYYIATVYGAVHARVDDPDSAQRHAGKAIESLAELVKPLSAQDRTRRLAAAQSDEAFRSLRELPEWKQLMAELETDRK